MDPTQQQQQPSAKTPPALKGGVEFNQPYEPAIPDVMPGDHYYNPIMDVDMEPLIFHPAIQPEMEETPQTEAHPLLPQSFEELQSETVKGVVGGAQEGLIVAPANLVVEGANGPHHYNTDMFTGLITPSVPRDTALPDVPKLAIDESLRTNTIYGDLVVGGSQFLSSLAFYKSIGGALAGKLGTAEMAAVKALNNGDKYLELGKTFQKIGELASLDAVIQTINFEGHQSNLNSVLYDLAEGKAGFGWELARYLNAPFHVDEHTPEIEARFKNGLSQFGFGVAGGSTGALLEAGARYFKAGQRVMALMQKLEAAGRTPRKGFMGIGGSKDPDDIAFEASMKEWDRLRDELMAKADAHHTEANATVLDDLYGTHASEAPPTQKTLDVSVNHDTDEINILAQDSEDAAKQFEANAAKFEKNLKEAKKAIEPIEIDSANSVLENVEKITAKHAEFQKKIFPRGKIQKTAAKLKKALGEDSRRFNKKVFVASIEQKLRDGMPIDFGEEVATLMGGDGVIDFDKGQESWRSMLPELGKVLKSTTPDKELFKRAKSLLLPLLESKEESDGIGGAIEALVSIGYKNMDSTQKAWMDYLGTRFYVHDVVQPYQGMLLQEMQNARIEGDDQAVKQLAETYAKVTKAWGVATGQIAIYKSFGGSILRTADDNVLFEGQPQVFDLQKALRRAKLEHGRGVGQVAANTEEGLKILQGYASEIANNQDLMTAQGRRNLGAQTTMVHHAINLASDYGIPVAQISGDFLNSLWHNNILGSLRTTGNILVGNIALGLDHTAKDLTGALTYGKGGLDVARDVMDESTAFMGYLKEGLMGSLIKAGDNGISRSTGQQIAYLLTEGREPFQLEYRKTFNPFILSQAVRERFRGSSIGDGLAKKFGARAGRLSDFILDSISGTINLIPQHLIGGADGMFSEASQRAFLRRELSVRARTSPGSTMSYKDALEHAHTNLKDVADDLFAARQFNFKKPAHLLEFPLKNKIGVSLDDLEVWDYALRDKADSITLQKPMGGDSTKKFNVDTSERITTDPKTGKQVKVPEPNKLLREKNLFKPAYSDRWLFSVGNNVLKWGNSNPLSKFALTTATPFLKTYFNAAQRGLDNNILTAPLSPTFSLALAGKYGLDAQRLARGNAIVGGALGLLGVGLAEGGYLTPVATSEAARRQQQKLTNAGLYSVQVPTSPDGKDVYNFGKLSPVADAVFLPGKAYQIARATLNGTIPPESALPSAIELGGQAFQSASMLNGLSNLISSLADPTNGTVDTMQNALVRIGGTLITPRIGGDVKSFTDPYSREVGTDAGEYFRANMPWLSTDDNHYISPRRDAFGAKLPSSDYIGDTQNWASNVIKSITRVGVRHVQNDPAGREVERFAQKGRALAFPTKVQNYPGTPHPYNLEEFQNEKGYSLYDGLMDEMENSKVRDYLNKVVGTVDKNGKLVYNKTYEAMSDDKEIRVTGKPFSDKGDRWATIQLFHNDAVAEAKNKIFYSPKYRSQFKNSQGQTIGQLELKVYDAIYKQPSVEKTSK